MPKTTHSSPIGPLLLAEEDGYIVEISFMGADTRAEFKQTTSTSPKADVATSQILEECITQLDAYFAGKLNTFTIPIKLKGTDFRMRVWEALRSIPYGETISYKELAQRIGQPNAIRAVGGANHHNPISIIVPCHRVIGATGKLVGYGGGLSIKEFLLNLEAKK